MLFSIIPVMLEFGLVAIVLLTRFDWRFAAVTFGAVVLYIAFTVGITEWRMDIRRRANELDSRANSRAIDSLLNYETVKYFNNEEFEARLSEKKCAICVATNATSSATSTRSDRTGEISAPTVATSAKTSGPATRVK
jgi:ABC-type transport system involved in Fe-S cluster assembly fused permease/ATPase subunit